MNNIENIWQFLENLNEYVYATDIETNELVYMNRKTLAAYELKSLEEIKGRKCYEVLQKSSTPCGICNNDRLCVGAFEEWRYYNPVIDKYLLLKDTLIADSARKKGTGSKSPSISARSVPRIRSSRNTGIWELW